MIIIIFLLLRFIVQIRVDRGIPEQVWLTKRRLLAQTVNDLGDRFHTTLHDAWLAYIKETYSVDKLVQMAKVSASAFVDDNDP